VRKSVIDVNMYAFEYLLKCCLFYFDNSIKL